MSDPYQPILPRLLDAGYPKEEIFHHYSDLYVYVTPLTTQIIDDWCRENGCSKDWFCPIFKNQINGRLMYDCVAQYYEIEDNCENETYDCDSCVKDGDCRYQGIDGRPKWEDDEDK